MTVRVDESLRFCNAAWLEDMVAQLVAGRPELTDVVLMCPGVNAIDASLAASEYGGLKNLELNNLTRDTDYVIVDGGLVFNLGGGFEAIVDYSHVVWGRNVAEVRNVTVGVSGRLL